MSPLGSGAGSSLPLPVLVLSGSSTLVAVLVSAMSIYLQLKNYRKPILQRCGPFKEYLCGFSTVTFVQDGYTNHGHGPSLRDLVSDRVVFVGGCLCDRCHKGYLRGAFVLCFL